MTTSSSSASSTVQLYRYDLTNGMARSMAPMLIGRPLEGIWHTSIVVFGKEFYFDGGIGVVADAHPGRTRFGTPYRTETLGTTRKSETAFMAWCQARRQGVSHDGTGGRFGPNDYNLLQNNCNHFSQAASQFLLGQDIPADVRDMIPDLLSTPLGQMVRPMLEQMTSAPPGSAAASFPMPTATPATPIPGFPSSNSAARAAASASTSSSTPSTDVCRGLLSTRSALTPSEEEDVDLLKATLESNELIANGDTTTDGFETTLTSLNLLRTVMENIVAFPAEAKYRAVSTSSKTYTTKLKRLEPFGALDVLRLAGFILRPHASGTGGEQWYLSDAAGSRTVLQQLIRMLDEVIEHVETAQAVALSAKEEKHSPAQTAPAAARVTGLLRYAAAPFPAGYAPLVVGEEGGEPFYSTLIPPSQSGESSVCLGKCHPSKDRQHAGWNEAQYCAVNGAEKTVKGSLSVLCLRGNDADAATGCGGEVDQKAAASTDSPVLWVPAILIRAALRDGSSTSSSASSSPSSDFVFRAHGRFGVARAQMGEPGAVHAGVYEPSGRCLIPYGGRAQVVTDSAQVLCYSALLPEALRARVASLQTGDTLLETLRSDHGKPWGTFAALRSWSPPCVSSSSSSVLSVPVAGVERVVHVTHAQPCPLRSRHTVFTSASALAHAQKRLRDDSTDEAGVAPREDRTHLLVCHDMKGGYVPADYGYFAVQEMDKNSSSNRSGYVPKVAVVEEAYTVSYWQRTDVFVYFSHKRISVPPFEWIDAGHRRGVPVLGTIITEGSDGEADLVTVLTNAKAMGQTINKLVDLCLTYGFDGYLLNVENALQQATYVKRLELFTKMLRAKLLAALPHGAGLVMWYDAVTVDGHLRYQNALTPKNKPFMDVCDGLFTNYFWNPMHLAMSKASAAGRERDVFVGVDVFGRHMFGGGQYNTHTAVQEAAKAGLSVALFAPAWTCECEGHGTRETFLKAESRLWARVQDYFMSHSVSIATAAPRTRASCESQAAHPADRTHPSEGTIKGFWTCFTSGVGTTFNVDGQIVCGSLQNPSATSSAVVNRAALAVGWCQLSAAHQEPCFEFLAPDQQVHQASWTREKAQTAALSAAAPSTPLTTTKAALQCRLPLITEGGRVHAGAVTASWVTEASQVWYGDRALRFLVPPSSAVKLLDVHEQFRVPSGRAANGEAGTGGGAAVVLHVDIAFLEEATGITTSSEASHAPPSTSRRVRLFYRVVHDYDEADMSTTSSSGITLQQVDLSESADAAQCELVAEYPSCAPPSSSSPQLVWCVRRYSWTVTPASLGIASGGADTANVDVVVRAVSISNACRDRSLRCHVGGLATFLTSRDGAGSAGQHAMCGEKSPLVMGTARAVATSSGSTSPLWQAYETSTAGVQVLAIPHACFLSTKPATTTTAEPLEVAVFAQISKKDEATTTTTLFIGVHRVAVGEAQKERGSGAEEPVMLIPVHAPSEWCVKKIHYYPYSLPY